MSKLLLIIFLEYLHLSTVYNSGCTNLNLSASGTGFTDDNIATMTNYFMKNINIDGLGGVSGGSGTSTDTVRDEVFAMNAYL